MFYESPLLALLALLRVFAFTGGEWALITASLVGSSGFAGLVSLWVAFRKTQADRRRREIEGAAAVKTVAVTEAESAMRIMGESLTAANERATRCEDAWLAHIKVCPLWKDPNR